jgi:Uma2 family endonuclease
MRTDITKKLFTVDDYYRMAEARILKPEDRVELIEGEVVEMSPIGNRHAGCVNRATDLFTSLFRGRAIVTVQNPLRLNEYNELQPDLILAKPRSDFYAAEHPTAADIFLAVEIADTTLHKDRMVKVPIYARLGVPEVWIADLQHDRILIFRNASGATYETTLTLQHGDALSVEAFPEIAFGVDLLLGPSRH